MLYSKQITISAGTTAILSSKTIFKVSKGVITNIWINFPNGCNNLVFLRLYHEGHPFLPVNQDNYIRGNNYTYQFPVMYEITDEPMIITAELWSPDTSHDHTIDILFLVLPKEVVMPVGATEGILESLKSLVLRPIIITEAEREEIQT